MSHNDKNSPKIEVEGLHLTSNLIEILKEIKQQPALESICTISQGVIAMNAAEGCFSREAVDPEFFDLQYFLINIIAELHK